MNLKICFLNILEKFFRRKNERLNRTISCPVRFRHSIFKESAGNDELFANSCFKSLIFDSEFKRYPYLFGIHPSRFTTKFQNLKLKIYLFRMK